MTVSSQTPITLAVGTGAATTFPASFRCDSEDDAVAIIDGVEQSAAAFSVTGLGGATCSFVFTTAPANGAKVALLRRSVLQRLTDYATLGDFRSEVVNPDFDRLWLALQEFQTGAQTAVNVLRAPTGESISALSDAASRADKILAFDSSGNPVATAPVDGTATALAVDLAGTGAGQGAEMVGHGSGTVADALDQFVSVLTEGAVGAPGTDDQAAISAAITKADALGRGVWFPATAGGQYDTSAPLAFTGPVWMDQPVNYTGTADVAVVTIGSESAITFSKRCRIGARRSTRNWGNNAAVGVKLVNLNSWDIDVFDAQGNTIGVLCQGIALTGSTSDMGWQQNRTAFGLLANNKRSVVLQSAGISSTSKVGYVNENLFFGGNLQVGSTTETTVSRYGIEIESLDGNYLNNNNNHFFKPCLQLNDALSGGAESVGVVISDGLNNYVHGARFEGNTLVARFENASTRNIVEAGYCDGSEFLYEDNSTLPENFIIGGNERASRVALGHVLFAKNDIASEATGTSGTSVTIPGLSWGTSASATITAASSTSVTYDSNYVTVPGSRAFGVFVDTTTAKKLLVRRHGTAGGRIGVVCYDAGGAITTTAGSARGSANAALSSVADFGGSFRTGSDSMGDQFIGVADAVKKVWVFFTGGTASAVLSGFSIAVEHNAPGVRVWKGA